MKTEHYYLDTDGRLAVAFHAPGSEDRQSIGVVICYPIGHEHTHSFSTHMALALRLAAQGYPVLRFDYSCTGNSAGEMQNAELSQWVADFELCCRHLIDRTGIRQLVLFGTRLGATIPLLGETDGLVSGAILWNPVIDGRRFARDLEALTLGSDDHVRECGGFAYPHRLLDEIKKIRPGDLRPPERCLVIDRDDAPAAKKIADVWRDLSTASTRIELSGYTNTMRQPQFSEVASNVIDAAMEWMGNLPETELPECSNPAPSKQRQMVEPDLFETPHLIEHERGSLYGVLTAPRGPSSDPIVLIPNTGAAHNIGPGRLHVYLSRSLARAGVTSFRFDLSNIGESATLGVAELNNPYPSTAQQDVSAVLKAFPHRFKEMVGICSGAHLGFHLLRKQSDALNHLTMVNTLIYTDAPDRQLETTFEQGNALTRLNAIGKKALGKAYGFVRQTGFGRKTRQVMRDLKNLVRSGKLSVVSAENDDSLQILRDASGTSYGGLRKLGIPILIEGADHTFSTQISRQRLFTILSRRLTMQKPDRT